MRAVWTSTDHYAPHKSLGPSQLVRFYTANTPYDYPTCGVIDCSVCIRPTDSTYEEIHARVLHDFSLDPKLGPEVQGGTKVHTVGPVATARKKFILWRGTLLHKIRRELDGKTADDMKRYHSALVLKRRKGRLALKRFDEIFRILRDEHVEKMLSSDPKCLNSPICARTVHNNISAHVEVSPVEIKRLDAVEARTIVNERLLVKLDEAVTKLSVVVELIMGRINEFIDENK